MKEVIQDARSVDEAIELACQKLGIERDGVEFEIINLPKRGFLGLMNTPARVRVYLNEPEKPAPAPERKAPPKPAERPAPPAPKPAPRPEQQRLVAPVERSAPAPAAENKEEPREPRKPMRDINFVPAAEVDGKARTAADYLKAVLAEMGVDAQISVGLTENGIILRLSGDGLGVIIGRRGETLDALQYLSGLVANRAEGDYIRVTIDSGNYREKREHTLEQLARKLANSALRRGRPSTLEPMNPYERRIIHATVSHIEGVSSSSIGEEPNRRVVITPDNMKPMPPRTGSAPRGDRPAGGSRPPRRDGDRPPRRDGDRPPQSRDGAKPFVRRDDYRTGPRRDGGNRPPERRDGPRPEGAAATPLTVDQEYAKTIEREAPAFTRPDPAEQPVQRESAAPAREQSRNEGEDLPLYGKIEL